MRYTRVGVLAAVLLVVPATLVVTQSWSALTRAVAAGSFQELFSGTPSRPLPLESSHWEVAYNSAVLESHDGPGAAGQAQHGPNCEAPGETGGVTHAVTEYERTVFLCRDHMMTHVPGGSIVEYDSVYLTPDQLVDLRSGSAIIRFDISTFATSSRDWLSVWVQPWENQEQRILDDDIPTSQGNPRNAIHIEMGGDASFFDGDSGQFHVEVFDGGRNRVAAIEPTGPSWTSVLNPSAQTRSTVEIVLSRNRIKVWMPTLGLVWVDSAIPTVPFSEGVVTFGHHNYGANKDGGRPNTWHWDNITISPSVPFTIIRTDRRVVGFGRPESERTFVFETPAPARSYLRFNAISEGVQVSFDGGPYGPATRTGPLIKAEHPSSYLMEMPEGTTRATFRITPAYGTAGEVQNPTIFARTAPPQVEVVSGDLFLGMGPGRGQVGLLVLAKEANAGQMVADLSAAGCPVEVLAVLEGGRWSIYIDGAPAQVNASFPGALTANTPFFVRCR
ncbi:MAG: hypothetical protein IT299_09540 [Dehalococcoidia bacterium]|nr:hypothetical protein [Dehalococcoidia bacterium]